MAILYRKLFIIMRININLLRVKQYFFLTKMLVFCFSLNGECDTNVRRLSLHKKMKFSIEDFFSKCDQIRGRGSGQIYWRNP